MAPPRVRFGPFALDPTAGVLSRDGQRIPLQPRTWELLLLLVENAGRLVPRAEIEAALWPDVIVTEQSLRQAVRKLRAAMGDGGDGGDGGDESDGGDGGARDSDGADDRGTPRWIETVPRRGLRFLGQLEPWDPPVAPAPAAPPPAPAPAAARTPAAAAGRGTNVGPLPAPIFGRDADIVAVRDLLAAGHRLVTLLGPGGIGKTTLARAVGRAEQGTWGGGVWFVDIAEARTGDEMCLAIAGVLGVQLGANPADSLATAMAAREPTLLLLDNAEQVVADAAALVEGWLATDARCTFLVTCRERLGIPGERLVPVDPLRVPAGLDDPAAVAGSDAGRLFIERARTMRPDYALTDAYAPAIAALLRALDGIPLAIELFAARLRFDSPAGLASRLHERLDVVTARRGAPARHATLRAAIAWSWDLLSAPERDAMARLSVLRDAFDLAAARALLPSDADALVASLVDKSLLRAADGSLRFLETLRGYAEEQLDPATARDTRARHAAHFLARVAADPFGGTLAGCAADLRAASAWAAAERRPDDAARLWAGRVLATPLGPWDAIVAERDHLQPASPAATFRRAVAETKLGLETADAAGALAAGERAVALAAAATPRERAQAWEWYARVLCHSARNAQAEAACLEGLALLGDRDRTAECRLAKVLGQARVWSAPAGYLEANTRAVALAEQVGETFIAFLARWCLASARLAEPAEADAAYAALLAEARAAGDLRAAAQALVGSTRTTFLLDQPARAHAAGSELLQVARAHGYVRMHVPALRALGWAEARLGDAATAQRTAARATVLSRDLQDPLETVECLAMQAIVARETGAPDAAALLAEADQLILDLGGMHPECHPAVLHARAHQVVHGGLVRPPGS